MNNATDEETTLHTMENKLALLMYARSWHKLPPPLAGAIQELWLELDAFRVSIWAQACHIDNAFSMLRTRVTNAMIYGQLKRPSAGIVQLLSDDEEKRGMKLEVDIELFMKIVDEAAEAYFLADEETAVKQAVDDVLVKWAPISFASIDVYPDDEMQQTRNIGETKCREPTKH